jgi:predicted ABC-type ATPase
MKSQVEKKIVMIAGPNGAGKTTLAFSLLPDFFKLYEFLNPDEIARGLSPLDPPRGNRKAGEILLQRIDEYIEEGRSFAFETTGSGLAHAQRLRRAKECGYSVHLIYLFVTSPDICLSRIRHRVAQGGHNVSQEDVVRRYGRGAYNVRNHYLPLMDFAQFYVCDGAEKVLFAFTEEGHDLMIKQGNLWKDFLQTGEKHD